MKRLFAILLVLLNLLLFSSCDGYNGIMFDHLSDPSSYHEYVGIFKSIFYFSSNKKVTINEFPNSIKSFDCEIFMTIELKDKDTIEKFIGGNVSDEYINHTYEFNFTMIVDNANMMVNNGFLEDIKKDEEIKFTSSSWIYMDSNFFEIIGISTNDKTYLNKEEGLNNFIEYMKDNKSIF